MSDSQSVLTMDSLCSFLDVYFKLGFLCFPVQPGGKVPACPHGFKDAVNSLADDVDAAFLAARFFNGWSLRETALRLRLDPRTMRYRETAWMMIGKAMYNAGFVPAAPRCTLAATMLSKVGRRAQSDSEVSGGPRLTRLARVRDIDYHDADLCLQE